MTDNVNFIVNAKLISFSKKKLVYEVCKRFSDSIQVQIFNNLPYIIKSNVDESSFNNFIEFLIDKNHAFEVTEENALDYHMLCIEFNIICELLIQDEDRLCILSLKRVTIDKDSSKYEEMIAQKLDYCIKKYEKELKTVPVTSLYNIFNHKKRVLHDEEKAYQLIKQKINENPEFSVLKRTINSNNINYETFKESVLSSHKHYGFNVKIDISLFEKYLEDEDLLSELYYSSIHNRLDELNNPTNEEKKRWSFELTQNAKDTLYSPSNTTNQKKVTITFELQYDALHNAIQLAFIHNGPPFTIKTFTGLVYKISQEKTNNLSTGRFGTGFLSTHVLSRKIDIYGDRIEKDKQIRGFVFPLRREGVNKEDIIKEFKKMREKHKTTDRFNFTKFVYPIESELSRECVDLGLIHLKKHIANILIFCPDIEFISIIENGKQVKYFVSDIMQINDYIFRYTILYNCTEENNIMQYIVVKNNKKDIMISIEIDNDNKIIPRDNELESLYITFPLIGSNKHVLPYALNSPDFEPTTERDALILYGNDEQDGKKTSVAKNREILMKSIDLYEILIKYLMDCKCSNTFELTKGLSLSENPYCSFDLSWYNSNFLSKMKKVLSNSITLKTFSNKNVLLKDIYFPPKEIKDEYIEQFIKLSVTNKYYPNIICNSDFLLWGKCAWKTLNYIDIDELINRTKQDFQLINRTTEQKIIIENQLYSLNEFISFIFKYDKNLLYKYSLIPDMNNEFKFITNNIVLKKSQSGSLNINIPLNKCPSVSDDIIQIMESINIPWKSTHMNKLITATDAHEDKMIDAEKKIIEEIEENKSLSFELMRFVLENSEIRKNMFYFITKLKIKNFSQIIVKNVNKDIWKEADNYVLQQIAEIISSFKPDEVKNEMEFIIKFLSVLINTEYINSMKIIPNANHKFCYLKDLSNKSDIFHDHFNPLINDILKIDRNENIIHTDMNIIKSNNDEQLDDFLDIINSHILNNSKISKEKQIKIAESVISIVPKNVGKSTIDIDNQNYILSIYQKLTKSSLIPIQIDQKLYLCSIYSWKQSNEIILRKICEIIQSTENLNKFKELFLLTEEDSFKILNFLYTFDFIFKNDEYPIIPCNEGKFMYKKDLKCDPGIGNDLLKLISYLDKDLKIKEKIGHYRIKIKNLEKYDVYKFYQDFNQKIAEAYKNRKTDPQTIEMIERILTIHPLTNSIENKHNSELVIRAHINFILNAIIKLKNPDLAELQRWPFELIQNATDCIENGNGKMIFIFLDDIVIFKHYGSPFTEANYTSLLYQYGGGKQENKSLIGRFGTGFLSTLVLARKVTVSGDLIVEENGKKSMHGFERTIYRKGTSLEQLKKEVEKMESKKFENQALKGETKFEFDLSYDPENKSIHQKAYKEGKESLIKNIPAVLLFNPSIKEITVEDKEDRITFIKDKTINGQIQTVLEKSTKKTTQRSFFYKEMNEKFDCKLNNSITDVNIVCLLEFGPNNNIIYNPDSLFIAFPLLIKKDSKSNGSFHSPFIINSLQFEPHPERDNITMKSENEQQSTFESSINEFIISKSVKAFEQIVDLSISKNCTDLFNICHGIKYSSKNEFLQEHYINKMREIILTYNVFETSDGYKKYDTILIPFIDRYQYYRFYDNKKPNINEKISEKEEKENEEKNLRIYDEFYNLVSIIKIKPCFINEILSNENGYFVKKEQCIKWNSLLWASFPSKINIDNFLEFISKQKNISNLQFISRPNKISNEEFIKDVLNFVGKMDNFSYILSSNNILINVKGTLVSSKKIYKFILQDDIFFEMMNMVKYDYKDYILHESIEYLYQNDKIEFREFKINDAIQEIKDKLNCEINQDIKDSDYIFFMKYVIENDEKRIKMNEYTKKFLKNDIETASIKIPLDEMHLYKRNLDEMFRIADKKVINQLIQKVTNIDVKQNIDFLFDFVNFLKENFTLKDFGNIKLYPNQAFELCFADELKNDLIKDEKVKSILMNSLNIKINTKLIIDSFSTLINCKDCSLQDISSNIYDIITQQGIQENHKKDIYSIILENSEKIENLSIIIDLFELFNSTKIKINNKTDDCLCCFSSKLTSKIMEMIVKDINRLISQFSNINEIKDIDIGLIYKKMPTLYNLSIKYNCIGKIFPTESGDLKSLDEIKIVHDLEIKKDLIDKLIDFLTQINDYKDLKKSFLNKLIDIPKELEIGFEKYLLKLGIKEDLIINLNWLVEQFNKHDPRLYLSHRSTDSNTSNNGINNTSSCFNEKDFLNFIMEHDVLNAAFYKYIIRANKSLPKKIYDNLEIYRDFGKVDDDLKDFKKILENLSPDLMNDNNFIIAVLYEKFQNSKNYIQVTWPLLSQIPTIRHTQYNGKTYYLNDNSNENYDILAEDVEYNKHYFVVKLINDGDQNLINQRLKFALELSKENETFTILYIDENNLLMQSSVHIK